MKALELAEQLEEIALNRAIARREHIQGYEQDAAQELRRLAEVNAELLGALEEPLDEIESVLNGSHKIMETVSGMERRVGPVGSHARGYTHKITMALERIGRVRSAIAKAKEQQ